MLFVKLSNELVFDAIRLSVPQSRTQDQLESLCDTCGSWKHTSRRDQQIAQQAEIIAQLERENQHTTQAREYLATMEMLQVTRSAIRDRLMKELAP